MSRIKKNILRGWAEILLRLGHDNLASLDHIDPEDYMAVGSLLPLAEYEAPFAIYETFLDGEDFALPRPLARYDIINFAFASPKRSVTSMLLIELDRDMHLVPADSRIHYNVKRPLALLPLPVVVPFCRGVIENI